MKVFISWSGEKSKKYAECIKEWIEQCIQSVNVFFSPEDIEKGKNWNLTLTNELASAHFGIVCLTSENKQAPWIAFEAGALSKMLSSKVVTIATDINISDIQGPLATFQATKLEKEDLYKLLESINIETENPLSEDKLKKSFNAFYGELEKKIKEIKQNVTKKETLQKKGADDINVAIEEILRLTRNVSNTINNPEMLLPPDYMDFIMQNYTHEEDKVNYVFETVYDFLVKLLSYLTEIEDDRNLNELNYTIDWLIKRISKLNSVWTKRFILLSREFNMNLSRPNSKKMIVNK